jgi:hypothetical protein
MVRTAEQHSKLATLYERLVNDQYASPEQRLKFARKAIWHRVLSRIAKEFGLVSLPE